MNHPAPTIALINAVDGARAPAALGFDKAFPEATVWNLLDDRLITDALAAGGLTPALKRRMMSLISHAVEGGADGVLLTCSMYSPVAAEVTESVPVPVLSSDRAAFESAVSGGYSRIALVSSLEVPLADAHARFQEFCSSGNADEPGTGQGPTLDDVLASGALEPSRTGDTKAVATALERAITALPTTPDAVLLAQYSIAPAAEDLSRALSLPVISGPARAAATLRSLTLKEES